MMNFKEAAAFIAVKRETVELEAKLKEDRVEAMRSGDRYSVAVDNFKLTMLRNFKHSLITLCPQRDEEITLQYKKDGQKYNVCIICQSNFGRGLETGINLKSDCDFESEKEPSVVLDELGDVIIELAENYDEMPEKEAIELIVSKYNEKYNNKKDQERTRKK